jgi:hypothetical protein
MFLTVLGKYALTPHVLDDETLPDRPVWVQVDCVVLSWIFATVSSDLQQSLMICQRRAREAWCYLEDEFQLCLVHKFGVPKFTVATL